MLQPGAHTEIVGSTLHDCHAWSSGGALCTEIIEDTVTNGTKPPYDLRTRLVVSGNFANNTGVGHNLYVGPYFALKFPDVQLLNSSSPGVIWRKRLCSKGQYLGPSSYCEECPAYTYSQIEDLDRGHMTRKCDKAPNNAHAPGGPVLVPAVGYWHGDGSIYAPRSINADLRPRNIIR